MDCKWQHLCNTLPLLYIVRIRWVCSCAQQGLMSRSHFTRLPMWARIFQHLIYISCTSMLRFADERCKHGISRSCGECAANGKRKICNCSCGYGAQGLARAPCVCCTRVVCRLPLMTLRLAVQSGGKYVRHGESPARSRFQGIESWGKWPPE